MVNRSKVCFNAIDELYTQLCGLPEIILSPKLLNFLEDLKMVVLAVA